MKDIDIKNEYGNFKLRVGGIIIKDNKILLLKHKQRDGYTFPGGHVELGELTNEAIIREIKEELNVDPKIMNLFVIEEHIYKNNKNVMCQEINYYFNISAEFKDFSPFTIIENDKGKNKIHEFEWFDINLLKDMNVEPEGIVKKLVEDKNNKNIIVTSDYR